MTIPPADIAFAHELRQEYGMPWKLIERELGYDHGVLRCAVSRAVRHGVRRG